MPASKLVLYKYTDESYIARFRQHADSNPQWIIEQFLKELK